MMSRTENGNVADRVATKGVKERIVDIYVSAESLFVYDKPWIEGDSKGEAVENEYSEVAKVSGQKKAYRIRAVLPWLLVVLLLVVVTGLGIALKEEKIQRNFERKEPMANHLNKTSPLTEESDQVQEKLCGGRGEWKRYRCSCYSICSQNKRKNQKGFGTTACVGPKTRCVYVWRWLDGTIFPTMSFGYDSPVEEACALMKDINPSAQRPQRRFTCSSKQNWTFCSPVTCDFKAGLPISVTEEAQHYENHDSGKEVKTQLCLSIAVSPLIKTARWSALFLGMLYGKQRFEYLAPIAAEERKIEEAEKATREEQERIAKALAEASTDTILK
ncbi:unnamed protein product [Gadus morhua 'NCC']